LEKILGSGGFGVRGGLGGLGAADLVVGGPWGLGWRLWGAGGTKGTWGPGGPGGQGGGAGKGGQEKPKTTTGSNHQAQNGVTETKSGTKF